MTKTILGISAVLLSIAGFLVGCNDTVAANDCKVKCQDVDNTCVKSCNDDQCKTACKTDLDNCSLSCESITATPQDGGGN